MALKPILKPIDPQSIAGFLPLADSSVSSLGLLASTSSAAVQLIAYSTSDPSLDPAAVPNCIAVWNTGANTAFVSLGASTAAATVPTSTNAGSLPVSPSNGYVGAAAVFALHPIHAQLAAQGSLYLAAITNTSTSQLYFALGIQGVGPGG